MKLCSKSCGKENMSIDLSYKPLARAIKVLRHFRTALDIDKSFESSNHTQHIYDVIWYYFWSARWKIWRRVPFTGSDILMSKVKYRASSSLSLMSLSFTVDILTFNICTSHHLAIHGLLHWMGSLFVPFYRYIFWPQKRPGPAPAALV